MVEVIRLLFCFRCLTLRRIYKTTELFKKSRLVLRSEQSAMVEMMERSRVVRSEDVSLAKRNCGLTECSPYGLWSDFSPCL